MPDLSRVQLHIAGRVQGVGFRYNAVAQARRLDLTGWVRNTTEGAVELVAEGVDVQLQQLVGWCRSGPPGAVVTHVEVSWTTPTHEFLDFRMRR